MTKEFTYEDQYLDGGCLYLAFTDDLKAKSLGVCVLGDDSEVKFSSDLTAQEETDLATAVASNEDDIKWRAVRVQQSQIFDDVGWIIHRHKQQVELGVTTSITSDNYDDWLQYFEDVRAVDAQSDPDDLTWPTMPW